MGSRGTQPTVTTKMCAGAHRSVAPIGIERESLASKARGRDGLARRELGSTGETAEAIMRGAISAWPARISMLSIRARARSARFRAGWRSAAPGGHGDALMQGSASARCGAAHPACCAQGRARPACATFFAQVERVIRDRPKDIAQIVREQRPWVSSVRGAKPRRGLRAMNYVDMAISDKLASACGRGRLVGQQMTAASTRPTGGIGNTLDGIP